MISSCRILTDGRIGTENNARGLAEALGLAYDVQKIALRQPWKSLSPWLRCGLRHAFVDDGLRAPWPDILITAGRTPAVGSLYIGQQSPGTMRIHITDPGIPSKHFDLVVAPMHDVRFASVFKSARTYWGENTEFTVGALHRITPEKLESARAEFLPRWEHLPRPWHGLILGGSAHGYQLTPERVTQWLTQLEALGGSIICTTSRRTEPAVLSLLDTLRQRQEPPAICWRGEGPNPFLGILACTDHLFVTCDSVSMLSEAASTGTPTYLLEMAGEGDDKLRRCHEALLQGGHIYRFDGQLAESAPIRLDDMGRVVARVRELLVARGKLSV